jgi:NAD-dependent dihydropyrimidine dehydrogenase PreA subunit
VAGAAVTLDGASEVLKGTEDRKDKVYIVPNIATPNRPVIRDPEICNGCNTCVNIYQIDVYIPNPVKGLIWFPDSGERFYEGHGTYRN